MKRIALAMTVMLALALCGCGGTKVLREARAYEEAQPLLEGSSPGIAIAVDRVVIRNGPGSWARDALWDEYRLRVHVQSAGDVKLVRIRLVDALGTPVDSVAGRGALIDATRNVEERYGASGKFVREEGTWLAVAGGTAAAAAGTGGLAAAAVGTGGFVSAGAVAGAVGLVGGAVFLVGAGVMKLGNDFEVAAELERRQTRLPATIEAGGEAAVIAFFPIVPLPRAVEIDYLAGGTEQRARIEAQPALSQVHVPPPVRIVNAPEPTFPREAVRLGHRTGYAKAALHIDERGYVKSVILLDVSGREFNAEARRTFFNYRYTAGYEDRMVDATMEFKYDR